MPRRRDESIEPEEMRSEAPAEEHPQQAAPQIKTVSLIETVGQSVVVQWMDEEDDYHKSTVPKSEVKDGKASLTALQAGEDSFTWEGAGLKLLSVREQARALRKARIFDPEDYGKNPARATGSIHRLIGKTLTRIIKENRHA